MAVTLNASSTAGFVTTADTSTIWQLQTNGTTAVTVDDSQRVAFVAGTAALPAITTTGDTNTGIFFPTADTIAFAEGGTESMRITSTGTVAIGTTTTPTAKLWVESGRVGLSNTYKLGWHSNPAHGDLNNYITGDDGSNYVAIGTGAVERMRIDSSGRITQPYQPGCRYTKAGNATYTTTTEFIFDNINFDTGSNYNTSTGRFTAPVAGKYFVSVNVYTPSGSAPAGIQIRKNSSSSQAPINQLYRNASLYQTLDLSAVFDLSVGDYVSAWQDQGSIYIDANTSFSVYLLG